MRSSQWLIGIALMSTVWDAGCNLVVNHNRASLQNAATTTVASGDAAPATAEDATSASAQNTATPASTASSAPADAVVTTAAAVAGPFPLSIKDLPFYQEGKVLTLKSNAAFYDVEAALWSDGAHKFRYVVLPDGKQIDFDDASQKLTFPVGTYLVKHFTANSDGTHPVETRVMKLGDDKTWVFAAYKWNDDGTATLVNDAVPIAANADWPNGYRIPSVAEDCVKCHAASSNGVLGFQPDQLHAAAPDLVAKAVMSEAVAKKILDTPARVKPADTALDAKTRFLAYLDLNCGSCHRPGGPNSYLLLDAADIDMSFLTRKSYIVAGSLETSKIWQRFSAATNRMPQVSVVQDPLGTEIIKNYIMNSSP